MKVAEWADWLVGRSGSRNIPRPMVERQYRLIVETLVEMLGPLKREARMVWQHVMEHYGRTAAAHVVVWRCGRVGRGTPAIAGVLLIKRISARSLRRCGLAAPWPYS